MTTPASGRYPIETMRDRLRDYSRRVLSLERKITWPSGAPVRGVVAVATLSDAPDTDVTPTYVIDTDTYRYQGATHTPAEWQAMQSP